MANLSFNDITQHKLIPIASVVIYGNGNGYAGSGNSIELRNVMKDSNIVIDPITGKTGYGGERVIALKFKATIYFNNSNNLFKAALDELSGLAGYDNGTYSVPDGRPPVVEITLGRENEPGFDNKVITLVFNDKMQLSYSWVTADIQGKFGLVFTGVLRNLSRLT
jgi:hypothetical protein